MNIQEAKETIEKALRAYFARDEIGFPLVPLRQQRPILLIGPPGIGKTAIMEQIAEECGVGLVAYTMTHHTRQSAMGLPEICTRGIEGKMVHTTEYTMSEIIASIYDCMEQTGKKRGILFLDEINCVSETLAPVMLQLLQDKKFGNQHIPDDWLIVAAGNPPEYNKSVREFDVATLDRVRKIEVLPELSVWLSYAEKNQIHSAVTTYLMAHSDHFYSVSHEADEKRFVTARGWEDLSAVLKSYEILHFPVDEALIGQYLQEEKTAEEFSSYRCIFELRTITISGEAPQMFSCMECSTKENLTVFSLRDSAIYCPNCGKTIRDPWPLQPGTVLACRYIIAAPLAKLYGFTVNEEILDELERLLRAYLHRYVEKKMKTLQILDVMK